MSRRQTAPQQWLIVDRPPDKDSWKKLRRLAHRSGVLLLVQLNARERRRLRHLAILRDLTITNEERRRTARVHSPPELQQALLQRTPFILLSPVYPTGSHPGWKAIPRMRAAAYARLARRKLFALGGMNAWRYAKIAPLGFIGWAGISAFRT